MNIKNLNNECIVADKVQIARTFITRLKGLMFRKKLMEGEGIILYPCNIIHTFGMRFVIDVVFLSKSNKVIDIIENLPPNRVSHMVKGAIKVLELSAGTVKRTGIYVGNTLLFEES